MKDVEGGQAEESPGGGKAGAMGPGATTAPQKATAQSGGAAASGQEEGSPAPVPTGRPAAPPLLAVAGPTAVGKTALAVAVAREVPAEIVSADSMTVYRGMDIGTAKPTPAERALARFALIDVADPDEAYNLARFLDEARAAIADAHARHLLPILCGGTGLYLTALLRGYDMAPQDDEEARRVRAALLARLAAEGPEGLVAELVERDPGAAASVDLRNPRRVVRALEVSLLTGRPLGEARRQADAPPYDAYCAVVTCPRPLLYARINRRVDAMLRAGWLDEARGLLATYGPTRALADALGYGRLVRYLGGDGGWDQTIASIKRDTRRFAKRQLTWWRRQEGSHRMCWETAQDFGALELALARVARRLLWGEG